MERVMSDRNIQDLCPELQIAYGELVKKCSNVGITIKAITTWRDGDEQNAAKACGLSNAGAGQSPHNYVNPNGVLCALAFDFGVFDGPTYITDGKDNRYTQVGAIAKDMGLVWGGDWHHPDYDHVELLNWKQYGTNNVDNS